MLTRVGASLRTFRHPFLLRLRNLVGQDRIFLLSTLSFLVTSYSLGETMHLILTVAHRHHLERLLVLPGGIINIKSTA